MSKTTRKDYFGWPVAELEKWLPLLLENMRFSQVSVKPATCQATGWVVERVVLPGGPVDLRLELTIKWTQQAEGLTFIVSVEEPKCDWTECLCNRTADAILGALRTICEIYHGRDA